MSMTQHKFRLLVSLLTVGLFLIGLAPRAHGAVSAGRATEAPGFTFSGDTQDITDGDTYYFVANELVTCTISTRIGPNNNPGTFQAGYVADVVLKDLNVETLDWTQFIISDSIMDGWDHPGNNVTLETLTVQDDRRVIASGHWLGNPDIRVSATYEMLEEAPILKITVDVANAGDTDFSGFLEYQVDPDGSGNQNAYVPGVGWAPGLITSGWTGHYVYDGPAGESALPGHGIAWYADNPVAINAPGYIFGLWFDISVAAGDTHSISFYHITEAPSLTASPYAGIARWAEMIPILDSVTSDLGIIRGTVTDSTTGLAIPAATVRARNIHAETKGTATTDHDGDYSVILPSDVYTLTASALGHESASSSLNMTDEPYVRTVDFALDPISVWAGTGKRLSGALAQGTETDVVMENNNLAMSIAVTSQNVQLGNATMGKPLDLAVIGLADGLDWLNLPYISMQRPEGPDAWQITTVTNSSVEVIENDGQQAVVKATGVFTGARGVSVETFYTIEPNQPWIYAETLITNRSRLDLYLWIGDAIDNDESGQTSHVPGLGDVTTASGFPEAYSPTMPWIAQYGLSGQCYGLIYEGDFIDFTAYGTGDWIQSQKQVSIPDGTTYSLKRRIVAAPTDGLDRKSMAVEDIFYEVSGQESGLNVELALDDVRIATGEQTRVVLQLHNRSAEVRRGYRAVLDLPESLATDDPLEVVFEDIAPNTTRLANWNVTAVTGGRSDVSVTVHKANQYPRTRTATLFVGGPGWYAGDNHTHSVWSDGSGTIAQNVASARQKGLDFLTCTDHNTIKQAADVADQNSPDFIVLFGEEVTSSYGHSLAYNITSLIDWTLPAQTMIDSVNANNDGQGFIYIAHPYYPGLEWDHLEVVGFIGFEVWNGFYDPRHPVNSQSFDLWDQFNLRGRHLYGIANSDAHNVNKIGDPHIVAYLNDLTRQEILLALQSGTFYGTNGPEIQFTIDGQIMGGDIHVGRGIREVTIDLGGRYAEPLTSMDLIKNGIILRTWTFNATSISETVTDQAQTGDFYRAVIQNETGYAFSNPIWIRQ